jgi:hypothetical protein
MGVAHGLSQPNEIAANRTPPLPSDSHRVFAPIGPPGSPGWVAPFPMADAAASLTRLARFSAPRSRCNYLNRPATE